MPDAKVKALSQVPLFADCSQRELAFIASRTDEVPVGAGRQLTRQGRPSNAFYVILDGEADVEIDGTKRGVLKKGDFFGEISMLDRGNATASVTTRTPAKLMVMSHAQFRDVVKTSDPILVKVLAVMGRRLRADLETTKGKKR
ncbi:MAG TPA: cyclic nucleotide-binding domain-containing protein [Candidatus Dormibacteraeota bacterium]